MLNVFSVNLSVTSIASYLPSSRNNNATFVGTSSQIPKQNLTPMQEAVLRAEQAEEQAKDALKRNVVWAAEEAVELHDEDAQGEDDPDYTLQLDGTYALKQRPEETTAVGFRDDEGNIVPVPENMEIDEGHLQFRGVDESIPENIHDLVTDFFKEINNFPHDVAEQGGREV
jgi:meiosis-specific protein